MAANPLWGALSETSSVQWVGFFSGIAAMFFFVFFCSGNQLSLGTGLFAAANFNSVSITPPFFYQLMFLYGGLTCVIEYHLEEKFTFSKEG
jgi:hypothetical protein